MGKKKLLKLQRKEERKQEVFNKKESNKKTVISVVFLVLLAFGVYQINIAMNKNSENNISVNDAIDKSENKDDVDAEDNSTQDEEITEDEVPH